MKFSINKQNNESFADLVVAFEKGNFAERENGKISKITIGLPGKKRNLNIRELMLIFRQMVSVARSYGLKKFIIDINALPLRKSDLSDRDLGEILAVNVLMANFQYTEHLSEPEEGWQFVDEVNLVGRTGIQFRNGVERGTIIGEEVNNSRRLSDCPAGIMTPAFLAKEAVKAASGYKIRTEVLGLEEMSALGMGAVLGVAQGSSEEPKFIIMEYFGTTRDKKPIVLVGKGVTFDTGGLNLKPEQGIYTMHLDMSGGAAVIHTLIAVARLKLKKNVVAIIPAVENMPSGSSYRPGDVLKSMSGKTIEVLNTDAEGRIILADGLYYSQRYEPKAIIDVATLTGSAVVALGQRSSAIFGNNARLSTLAQKLGEDTGDLVWPLPLWPEFDEEIKGTFGDWANIGKYKGYGGAITAAAFLKQFVGNFAWLHIDIAPRMSTIDGEYLAKGSAGAPIRLLTRLIEKY